MDTASLANPFTLIATNPPANASATTITTDLSAILTALIAHVYLTVLALLRLVLVFARYDTLGHIRSYYFLS